MLHRLRQICLVARDIEPVLADLQATFGIELAIRDHGVSKHGLRNGVMPIGTSFLEVVSPMREGTTAGRYLDRLGGDGGYMVLLDGDQFEAKQAHLQRLGVRMALVRDNAADPYRTLHLHPKDVGATLLSIDQNRNSASLEGDWDPAGPHWHQHIRTDVTIAMVGVALQSPTPEALARRWATLLDRPARPVGATWEIALDNDARLIFVPAGDDRGETMQAIHLKVRDVAGVLARARQRGVPVSDAGITVGGVLFRLEQ